VALVRRGGRWCIRYYGPDGRQRWETIGPNKKEAETVLAQRIYEVRSGKYPILRRRTRMTFREHAEEWMESYARPHVRTSTLSTYRWLLDCHLLTALGERALVTLTPRHIQSYLALKAQQLSPKTVNHGLFLLKGILDAAVEWDRLPSNPARGIRPIAAPRREMRVDQ
jgi:integrase